jgi:hypothetical protein
MAKGIKRDWKLLALVYGSGKNPYRIALDVESGIIGCNCPAWTRGKYQRSLDDKHIVDVAHKLNSEPTQREVEIVGDPEHLTIASAILRVSGQMAELQR